MKSNPFYFEIKDVMTQFVAAFNDIIINRHDKDKNVRSRAHVRYVYSPKQRVVHDLTNKARHITLPVVAVNISGIARDNDRVFNKLEGTYLKYGESHESHHTDHILQPVPVNIDVNMSILARYQTDIEQIISNFVPSKSTTFASSYIQGSFLPSAVVHNSFMAFTLFVFR